MFFVYFEKNGIKREIGKCVNEKEVEQIINKFLEERKYKSYYWNIIKIDKNIKRIDVGSWSEFFYVERI